MHFAYQPRKNSNPPPFRQRPSRLPLLRRGRARTLAIILVGAVVVLFVLFRILDGHRGTGGGGSTRQPVGRPPVVIVTVLDPAAFSKDYIDSIRDNRILYAQKHGYEVFFTQPGDYDVRPAPASWTKVVAVRHALTKYPDCRYVWFLDQNAYIMNAHHTIEEQLMRPEKLEATMIKNFPVVPPDSIIKTFSHLRGVEVDFVISQDKEGLSSGSFVLRNGDWARFFLETWNDPLYRSYNFQKAETHALEHIVQWHPTILSKLALVPQKTINSYSNSDAGEQYQDGDFVVRFPECQRAGPKSCETFAAPFAQKWRAAFEKS